MTLKLNVRLSCAACGSSTVIAIPVEDHGDHWGVIGDGEKLEAWDAAHYRPKLQPLPLTSPRGVQ